MPKEYKLSIDINASTNILRIAGIVDNAVNKIDAKLKQLETASARSSEALATLSKSMTRLSFIAVPAFTMAFKSALKTGMDFEVALKDLSALTGMTGKQLDSLKDKALQLSTTWGLSATNVLAGMKRIASNKSEFMEIEGAIEKVSDAAAVLARASGMTFYHSGEVITATMNQFKLGLKDTNRIINTFAQGAKLGSFEVDALSRVFARAGGVLSMAGASFEDAMSISMVASRIGLTSEMVGTQLKTLYARLSMMDDVFNPNIVGFVEAMENLKKANLTPAALYSIMGMESAQVGQQLLNNIDLTGKWNKEIRKTLTAFEQSNKNMEAQQKKLERIKRELQNVIIEWYYTEEVQQKIRDTLDWIMHLFKQDTVSSRLTVWAAKWSAILVVVGVLVNALARVGGAIKFLWGLFSKSPVFGILQALNTAFVEVFGAGVAAVALVFMELYDILHEVVGNLMDNWDKIVQLFKAGKWLELGKTVGKLLVSGILQGLLVLAHQIASIFAPLMDWIIWATTGEKNAFSNMADSKYEELYKHWKDWGEGTSSKINTKGIIPKETQMTATQPSLTTIPIAGGDRDNTVRVHVTTDDDSIDVEGGNEALVKVPKPSPEPFDPLAGIAYPAASSFGLGYGL